MSTPPAARARRTVRALVAATILALAVSLVLVPSAQAGRGDRPGGAGKAGKAGKTADKPWSGYSLRDDGRAAGRFLGARKVGSYVVYRIDPKARKTSTKRFGTPTYADTLAGSGKRQVSALDTQRAAYLLGKYGAYRLRLQSAAVELALDELLVGGKYALTGSATKRRLAQLPKRARVDVVDLATTMLAQSAQFASTYAVAMTSTPSVTLGAAVTAVVSVVNRLNGAGIANLPVTFTYPGAAPQVVRTDATGRATASFVAGAAGPQTVAASVANVPESRLVVLQPTTKKASRVVVADVKAAGASTAMTAVQARPALAITRSFGGVPSPYTTAGQRFSLAGTYPTPRTATATLWGPYTSDAAATCRGTGKTAGRGSVAVRADGAYALPRLPLTAAGYYRWAISVPADAYNAAPATICGGVMRRVE